MNRFSDSLKPLVPNGSKEINLQIDTGETLPFCERREMSCANRGIGNVTQDATMNGSHGIRMELGLGFYLHGSSPFTDLNQPESKSLHNGKRKIERRLVRWADCAIQKFSKIFEIADARHDMLCAFCGGDTRTDSTTGYSLCFALRVSAARSPITTQGAIVLIAADALAHQNFRV